MRRLVFGVATFAAAALVATLPAQSAFYPLDDVKPGQVGIGRTVFAGDTIEEFKVNILGVLHNVIGPQRDLILAKLEGGPLATTGVIQGMSGSPVYIDGRLRRRGVLRARIVSPRAVRRHHADSRDDRGRERRRHAHGRQRSRAHVARDLGRGLCVSEQARGARRRASARVWLGSRRRRPARARGSGADAAPDWRRHGVQRLRARPRSRASTGPRRPRARRQPRSRAPVGPPTPPSSFAPAMRSASAWFAATSRWAPPAP